MTESFHFCTASRAQKIVSGMAPKTKLIGHNTIMHSEPQETGNPLWSWPSLHFLPDRSIMILLKAHKVLVSRLGGKGTVTSEPPRWHIYSKMGSRLRHRSNLCHHSIWDERLDHVPVPFTITRDKCSDWEVLPSRRNCSSCHLTENSVRE